MYRTSKPVFVLLAVLAIALGVVGHMDYEDSKTLALAQGLDTVRLICQPLSNSRSPVPAVSAFIGHKPRWSAINAANLDAEIGQTTFRCIEDDN